MRSLDPTISAWRTEATPTNGSYENRPPICDMSNLIPQVLIFIISLTGLAGNASVLWFLVFHMPRNALYILNLTAADSLLLCLYVTICLIEFILHINIFTDGIIHTGVFIFYIAGLSMLCARNTEHFLSVLWPIWNNCHHPRHTSVTMCAF
ncbi:Mas-related G-protein coupled receptor member X2 [Sciurus carolinensis]|uniref:Mas-related G-protein coupled receptor member X2 n=1 Tax=Sciurus carolinensis TaxID=30640 RepID=A0AA41MM25_SCICA|nr:Mas-related G-protein coupled receptor member X2 [Sciurus carolinensis]